MTPFEVYPTADRDIVIALGSEKDWPRFCSALELQHLIDDPRYRTDAARIDNRASMNRILNDLLIQNSSDYWQQKLLAEYGAFSAVTTASGRAMRFVRNPIAAADSAETAAPALGQHSDEILAELGLDS